MIDVLKVVAEVLRYAAGMFLVLLLIMLAVGGVWLDFEKRARYRRNARASSFNQPMTSVASAEKTSTSSMNDTTLFGPSKDAAIDVAAGRVTTNGGNS